MTITSVVPTAAQQLNRFAAINLTEATDLKGLLELAGMYNCTEAGIFWRHAGMMLTSKVCLQHVAIEFFEWPTSLLAQLLCEKQMKAATFYEVLILAATQPQAFHRLLQANQVVIPSEGGHAPFLCIRLEDEQIILHSIEHQSNMPRSGVFGAVHFTPST